MPRGDRTGPYGEGPMTGRGVGHRSEEVMRRAMTCRGPGWALRGALGEAVVGGTATGSTRRACPWWARFGPSGGAPVQPPYDEAQEVADLKAHASRLDEQLGAIQARLEALMGTGEGGE